MQLSALCLLPAALALGSPLPAPDNDIPSVLAVPFTRTRHESLLPARHRRDVPDTLVTQTTHDNWTYISTVQVGTPGQSVQVWLDTGSADFWVYSADVEGRGATFNANASSTFREVSKGTFEVDYGGFWTNGDLVNDTVNIFSAAIPDFTFGLSVEANHALHGMLGLLPSSFSEQPSSSNFIETLKAKGYIARLAYSVSFENDQSTNGEIVLGGIDTEKYEGKLRRFPWSVPTVPAIAGEFFGYNHTLILDTGASDIYVDESAYQAALVELKKSIPTLQSDGGAVLWVDSRSEVPTDATLPLTLGNTTYEIPLQNLLEFDGTVYLVRFKSMGGNFATGFLGDPFYRTYYVTSDSESHEFGIAPARDSSVSRIVAIPEDGIPAQFFENATNA